MREADLAFSGEYLHQLDEKVRFKLPKRMEEIFREELGVKCVLMKMPEPCVAIYPREFWNQQFGSYLESVDARMPGNARHRAFTRMISSNSFESKVGAQGRVALTDNQKKYIGVDAGDNLVIVGAGERIELWSEQNWSSQQEKDMAAYHSLVEEVSAEMKERKQSDNGEAGE